MGDFTVLVQFSEVGSLLELLNAVRKPVLNPKVQVEALSNTTPMFRTIHSSFSVVLAHRNNTGFLLQVMKQSCKFSKIFLAAMVHELYKTGMSETTFEKVNLLSCSIVVIVNGVQIKG